MTGKTRDPPQKRMFDSIPELLVSLQARLLPEEHDQKTRSAVGPQQWRDKNQAIVRRLFTET